MLLSLGYLVISIYLNNFIMTKYSFIVPVFNTKLYLERCVKSILQQSYQHYEILLIDDGSTDGSGELCDKLSHNDIRIKVFHQPNSGVSIARNNGIKHAIGDFLIFIDSDDWISINYLNCIEYMVASVDCEIFCYKNFISNKYINENKKNNFTSIQKLGINEYIKNGRFYPALWSYVFKRSVVLKYNLLLNKDLRYSEDSNFIFKYLLYSTHIAISNERLYFYFLRNDSAIHQEFTHKWAESNLIACLDILYECNNLNLKLSITKKIISYYITSYFTILFKMKSKKYNRQRAQEQFLSFCHTLANKYNINIAINSKWSQKHFTLLQYLCCISFFIYRLKNKILK